MTVSIVDARFAGGPILVQPAQLDWTDTTLVSVEGPGFSLGLFPHEAQALADALSAAVREEARHLRRPPEVDDRLRELDD